MSPRRPHLRNRKTIKTPKRFEDEYILTSPLRQEIPEESEESSELEEEIYESPRQRKPPSKRTAYRGKVTGFNPNLPPAAFPTLDHPDYVHNGGTVAIDLQPNESEVQSQNLASHEINVTRDLANMTSTVADFTRRASQHVVQPSITVKKQPQGSKLSSLYGESTDNGPRNPIWASNMARIAQAAKMSNLDRIMLEMESSDEEDAADRGTKIAGTATIPEFPAWDDLTVAHKLDLADTIAELYPDFSQVTHQLRLTPSQKEELVGLLGQRQDRAAREQANERRLQKQTKDFLLQGEHLSQSTFHQMVEDNLYKDIDKNDHHQTNLKELKKARAYLRYCGFPRALADDSWNVPSITNVTTIAKSRPMPSKPKASLSNVPAQTPSSPSERPSLRRPALYTRSQQSSYQSDHRSESVLPKSQGGAPSQYRPTPAHALITQHSPAAPLSKVPLQSFRVAPSIQNGDPRAEYPGTTRVPQPSSSALQDVQPNGSTSTDQGAITTHAPLKAYGESIIPSYQQEEHSLLSGSHSQSLPRRNQRGPSNAKTEAGPSAPHRNGCMVENGESVNKRNQKKVVKGAS